jgi:hypothetical protein
VKTCPGTAELGLLQRRSTGRPEGTRGQTSAPAGPRPITAVIKLFGFHKYDVICRIRTIGGSAASLILLRLTIPVLQVPNGELTSGQLRELAACIAPYGKDGCGDITTRANIQLRGIPLKDASDVVNSVQDMGLTSFMTGMDNVRNLTGSPIAGLDPEELLDVRPMLVEMQVPPNHLRSSQLCYNKNMPVISTHTPITSA